MSNFVFEVLVLNSHFIRAILDLNSEYPVCLVMYLFPSFIALVLKKQNLRAIFVCNLFVGFTGITWFVILTWALVEPKILPQKKDDGKLCPNCFELIRYTAIFCHHCHQPVAKTEADNKPKCSTDGKANTKAGNVKPN